MREIAEIKQMKVKYGNEKRKDKEVAENMKDKKINKI